jgi:acyl-coenzyme A synthetase/AMP-(fatty) acid ligase
VQKIAYYLAGRGVGPGDRILLNIGNIPEFIYVLLAAAQRGVISVLSNPAYRGFELQHLIEEVEPKLAVTTGAGMANFLIDGTRSSILKRSFFRMKLNEDCHSVHTGARENGIRRLRRSISAPGRCYLYRGDVGRPSRRACHSSGNP